MSVKYMNDVIINIVNLCIIISNEAQQIQPAI